MSEDNTTLDPAALRAALDAKDAELRTLRMEGRVRAIAGM